MMKGVLSTLLLGLSVTAVGAVDIDDLAPCKPAAAKYCDHSSGKSMSNLLRCGATLAARSHEVGNQCRQVLRRYGQL
jgi:hypothetical protein